MVISQQSAVIRNCKILVAAIAVIGYFQPVYAATLPFATAPTGSAGGLVAGEFENRTLDGEKIYVRRAGLRFGWTPSAGLSVWGEGGIGSVQLFDGSRQPQGAFGPAFGIGCTFKPFGGDMESWTPIISARATTFMSRLSDDYISGTRVLSRRSQFTWTEGSGMIGLAKSFGTATWFGGAALRDLTQDENRSLRAGASIQKNEFTYDSGLKPGGVIGASFGYEAHILAWIAVEGYSDGFRVTLAVGQWGTP